MTAPVRSLSELLREAKSAIGAAHDKIDRLKKAVGSLNEGYGKVDEMTKDVESAAAEVHAMVGQISNGGPPLEDATFRTVDTAPAPANAPSSFGFVNLHHGTGDPKMR